MAGNIFPNIPCHILFPVSMFPGNCSPTPKTVQDHRSENLRICETLVINSVCKHHGTTRQPSASPLHLSNAQIGAKWTQTSNKDWVLNTRFLDQYLTVDNLRCSLVPAHSNCGYHAVIRADNLKLPFSNLKHQVLTYLNKNEAQIRSTFPPTTTSNMAKFLEILQQKLSYAGAYTNHHLLQLTS